MATRPPLQVRGRRPFRERLRSRIAHLSFLATRPMTLGVRGVVIDAAGAVLLVKHTYTRGLAFSRRRRRAGRDLRERARARTRRGGQCRRRAARCSFTASSSTPMPRAATMSRSMSSGGSGCSARRAPDREILAARFFAPDALPEDATRGTRARLAEILDSQPLAAHW